MHVASRARRVTELCRAWPWLAAALLAVIVLSGPALALGAAAPVRLGDAVVFTLGAPDATSAPKERAARASAALARALEGEALPEVRIERSGDVARVLAGETLIVELGPEDARLAGASSLDTYASDTAGAVQRALGAEKTRRSVAETAFSCSLVVFFALIAFYLIKQVTRLAEQARVWAESHGERAFSISVKNVELVSPAVLRSSALILLGLGKWIAQFGIFYAWLVVVLSLFETTRGYTERLTGFVLAPLSQLMGRAITALPLVVVMGVAALGLFVLVRFVGLFMRSVARRETTLGGLPADLAPPLSVLVRIAIVVLALVFGAPIVTGSDDGSLGRTGAILLVALGLSATPLFTSMLLGAIVLFGRRLRVGEYVQVRGSVGRISAIDLLELRLETSDGTERRIPHLLLWASAIERFGTSPRLSVDVAVPADAAPGRVLELLLDTGGRLGKDPSAELVRLDGPSSLYRLSATCPSLAERSLLLRRSVEALHEAGIPLGHGFTHGAASRQP